LVRGFTENYEETARAKEGLVMYQMNDTEMLREHGPSTRRLRCRAALLFSAVSLAVILLSSAAYALNVECPPSIGGEPCIGTDGADVMRGTDGDDSIVGLGGDDVIHGLGGFDRLTGDGNAATAPGNDQLLGGGGSDDLVGGAGSDRLYGEGGNDHVSADFLFSDGTDAVEGGQGDDIVYAVEGQRDVIDCGPGRDQVQFDAGLDSVKRCEIKEAN
jgi:Ca2+-binding RTX toxin-like protein